MYGLFFRSKVPISYTEMMQCDRAGFTRFFHIMLEQGVYLAPSAFEAGFVSAAHGPAEIEKTIRAAKKAFAACT
jgi:glutamate-1-semialdehyde 2,1-aminomutase